MNSQECERCDGTGLVANGVLACPTCRGTGIQPTWPELVEEMQNDASWLHDPDMEDR